MQIVHPQILSRFTILSSRLLALQCSNAIKSSSTPPHYSNRVFTISQTYIFNIHIPVQAKKFNIFLARARTKIPLIMHQNTPFQVKNSIFLSGEGPSPSEPLPGGSGTPPYTTLRPHQAFWIRLFVPQNCSQIYAIDFSVVQYSYV